MSEETVVPAAEVPAPVVEAPKEHSYKYQPRDENQNPLGGEQVIKYDGTPEDLGNKMAEQNAELIKLNRRLKKDLRLGNLAAEEIPQDAPKVKAGQYEFNPAPLSAEERIEIVRQLNDPESFDSAAKRLIRAEIGDPEAIRGALSRAEQKIAAMEAQAQAEAFVRSNPDYHVCQENFQTLANWMLKNELEPVKTNFQLAYDTLKEFMVQKPAPRVEPPPVAAEFAPTPAPRPLSSGLTRSNTSDSGPAPKVGFTDSEIAKMSSEEYKQKVLIPQFKAQQRQGRG